ncbi:Wadjet anti-phage system protein JetD domain-containing protein [Neobacillus sp. SAB-20_R2A]|uniref:Wadjet anti-phage system protein JetD domain-containing protein n=1 Tax=Neobacillus sp. SAB-20_R2A TaxID=3120519 RepID=UPI003C6E7691
MKEKMKAWLTSYFHTLQLPARRKKIHIQQIEDYIIKEKFKDPVRYQMENGYRNFVEIMLELSEEQIITPVKKSPLNGRRPSLHSEWWLEKANVQPQWSDMQILALSDLLNLAKYRQHLEWQTIEELERVQAIYTFLKQKDQFTWVTREERSFQLFGEEKLLANEGAVLLQRLQLPLEALKARVYGEPFAFWPAPNRDIRLAKTVLIVENQSFYHTCRLLMNMGKDISGIRPDLLIYGEGKKIEKSFNFLRDITSHHDVSIQYVGDIDPEGWGIYIRLKDTYPEANIRLAVPIYEAMIKQNLSNKTETNQNENLIYLARIIDEFKQHGHPELAEQIQLLWEQKRRVPQETLSLDTIEWVKE